MKFLPKLTKLSNAVRLMTIPMESVESTAILVIVKTGSRNEMASQAGISHVLEHMPFKGTEKYPTPLEIARAIDALGAEYNAYTGKEYTGFYIHADSTHFERATEILGQMLVHPLIAPAELAREQGVIIEEINMYEDEPMERAGEEIENVLFGGSSLGRLIIGTKETVKATTRESLLAYKDIWYRGGNILVVVAGKIEEEKAITTQIETQLSGIPKGEILPFNEPASFGTERSLHLKKKTEQSHIAMAFPGYSMIDPKRVAAKVLTVILGGTMGSRLFAEVREKRGLAYYVSSGHEAMADIGQIVIRAGVRVAQTKEAIEVIKNEVFKIACDVTESELKLAKDNMRGRTILSLTDPMGVAQYFGHRTLVTNDIVLIEDSLRELSQVTREDLVKVATSLLVESELRTVVVGPKF